MYITFLNWLDKRHTNQLRQQYKSPEQLAFRAYLHDILHTTFINYVHHDAIPETNVSQFIDRETDRLFFTIMTTNNSVKHCLDQYKTNLEIFLIGQLPQSEAISSFRIIKQASMQYLEECRLAETGTFGMLNRLANAHAFIQFTGFSTQNENSVFAWADFYNYLRHGNRIDEVRRTLTETFVYPFLPIYFEFQKVAKSNASYCSTIIQVVTPLVITAAFVVFISALAAPLAIPEIASLVLMVPTLLIGLALASAYVMIKDSMSQSLYTAWHGGKYNIPEYQPSLRMNAAFGENNAVFICNYYVQEIEACESLQRAFATRRTLSTAEKKQQLDNNRRSKTLLLEWYDIHSNQNLGHDETPDIALARMAADQTRLKKSKDITAIATTVAPTIAHTVYASLDDSIRPSTNRFSFFPYSLKQAQSINSLQTHLKTLKQTREDEAHLSALNLAPV